MKSRFFFFAALFVSCVSFASPSPNSISLVSTENGADFMALSPGVAAKLMVEGRNSGDAGWPAKFEVRINKSSRTMTLKTKSWMPSADPAYQPNENEKKQDLLSQAEQIDLDLVCPLFTVSDATVSQAFVTKKAEAFINRHYYKVEAQQARSTTRILAQCHRKTLAYRETPTFSFDEYSVSLEYERAVNGSVDVYEFRAQILDQNKALEKKEDPYYLLSGEAVLKFR